MTIRFTVPGQPIAKGRPRMAVRGGHARAYTPAKTVAYEGLIALAGQQAMDGAAPLSGAVSLDVVAWFAIPASWPKKRKAAALAGTDNRHTSKPDGDNVLKAIGDGLNGVVWQDDSQIAEARVSKRYGETPCVAVTVVAL